MGTEIIHSPVQIYFFRGVRLLVYTVFLLTIYENPLPQCNDSLYMDIFKYIEIKQLAQNKEIFNCYFFFTR